MDCYKDLKEIDTKIYWYLYRFMGEKSFQEKKEINSFDEMKKQFYIISKKINKVFEHCSKNDEFNYIFKKYQKYIDEVLKPKYEIQKIKMKIEIIECMNAGIDACYTNFIDANPPYYD